MSQDNIENFPGNGPVDQTQEPQTRLVATFTIEYTAPDGTLQVDTLVGYAQVSGDFLAIQDMDYGVPLLVLPRDRVLRVQGIYEHVEVDADGSPTIN